MRRPDTTDGQGGHADPLSSQQAADLLGMSVRHVRRLIASGELAGAQRPYRTWRSAVDDYRRRQQGLAGDVLTPPETIRDADEGGDTYGAALASALLAERRVMREEMLRLSREVGRLEAELAQARRGHNGHKGQAAGALARLVPWLRG